MSSDAQRLIDYLSHIEQAIERIEGYTRGMDETAFAAAALVQDAVIRNLEVIGEASRRIEVHHASFAAAHPELPLAAAYQMRNAVAHGYFKVDLAIVWRTIGTDLPALRVRVASLRAGLAQDDADASDS